MPRYFGFLRALNVGGHTVRMDALRRLFEAAGLEEVETFIASGNVIFRSGSRDAAALERTLESRLEAALGYAVKAFLRTERELAAIACYQPFPAGRFRSAQAFCVAFLPAPLGTAGRKALKLMESDESDFRAHGREIHWLCQVRQSESAVFRLRFERRIGVPVTFRSRTTIGKLATKYALLPEGEG
jgi:uncharacterized protein (DUF1697 family)